MRSGEPADRRTSTTSSRLRPAVALTTMLLAAAGCLPGGEGASPASDPVPGLGDAAAPATSELSDEARCAGADHFCVAVIEGPHRPIGGRAAVAALVSGSADDTTVTRIELASAIGLDDALADAVAGFPDLVVVLPPQGAAAYTLESVRAAAEAWPTFRFVTIGDGDELELSNLAVIRVDTEAWAAVAADAAVLAAPGSGAGSIVGLVAGPDLDPSVVPFTEGFRATLERDGATAVVEGHPGALDGSHADPVWDEAAVERLLEADASVIVADPDGLYGLELPCVVIGSRPEPAPGCAVGVADPGVDAALARILERRRSGTGPAGVVVTEPRLVRVAGG